MKYLIAAAAVTAAALFGAPTASATTCEDVQAEIIGHNNSDPGPNATEAQANAYNAEADRLEAEQNTYC
jgi:ABC-type glycerol-3-phosphate transport system substrate-binding protein